MKPDRNLVKIEMVDIYRNNLLRRMNSLYTHRKILLHRKILRHGQEKRKIKRQSEITAQFMPKTGNLLLFCKEFLHIHFYKN